MLLPGGGVLSALPGPGDLLSLTLDDGVDSAVVRGYAQLAKDTGIRLTMFVTGVFASGPPALPEPLVRLVGRNRARILAELGTPTSTSALAAGTGLPLGSVGGHFRVLLDAGLIERRRSGREVLYWRSTAGESLVQASAG